MHSCVALIAQAAHTIWAACIKVAFAFMHIQRLMKCILSSLMIQLSQAPFVQVRESSAPSIAPYLAASYVKRGHDTVSLLEVPHAGAYLIHNAHELRKSRFTSSASHMPVLFPLNTA